MGIRKLGFSILCLATLDKLFWSLAQLYFIVYHPGFELVEGVVWWVDSVLGSKIAKAPNTVKLLVLCNG